MVSVWMTTPPPNLMQSGRQLNLAFVIGSSSSAGIDSVSATPAQGWGTSIQCKRGKEACFPPFCPFTLIACGCHEQLVAPQPNHPAFEPAKNGLKPPKHRKLNKPSLP